MSRPSAKPITGPTWRTAPDNFSYQKNQKFQISAPSVEKKFNEAGEKLIKPVFVAKDVHLTGEKQKPQSKSSALTPAAAPVVLSSRTMKASAPVSRAPVEVIDAGGLLKKFDEDAIGEWSRWERSETCKRTLSAASRN